MKQKLSLTLGIIALVMMGLALNPAEAAIAPQITGVWACEVSRPGVTATRPLVLVFHFDGILTYSSQTTVNGGPFSLPFDSRGGGYGEWRKVGRNDYAFRARENMYINGNAGGYFYMDSTLHLDPKTKQLCSGRPECPTAETKIRLTQFTFGPDGIITGEIDLLPAGSEAESLCSRLSDVFPGLP